MALKYFYIFLRQKVYLATIAAKTVFSVFRKTTYFFSIVSPLAMEINDSWIVLKSIFFIVPGQGGLFVGCSLTLLIFSALIMLVSKYNLFYFRQVNPDEVFSLLKFWILYCLTLIMNWKLSRTQRSILSVYFCKIIAFLMSREFILSCWNKSIFFYMCCQ